MAVGPNEGDVEQLKERVVLVLGLTHDVLHHDVNSDNDNNDDVT